jgi:hypothetical protein
MTKRTEPIATLEHVAGAAEAWATSEERLPVFQVRRPVVDDDGNPTDDSELITYTMPAKPNPGFALKYLKLARTIGDAASSWLIETACGEEAYDALADDLITYEESNPGQSVTLLRKIAERIQTAAMGGLDGGPKV